MAIVNRTPDSFYDQGATFAEDAAKQAVTRAVEQGADLIDLGGVTASPGAEVTAADEIDRVVPLVEWIRATYPNAIISIDTWRGDVAAEACQAGAHVLNDAWTAADPTILDVAAEYGAGYVCTHTDGRDPRAVPTRPDYDDVVTAVLDETTRLAELAESKGVPREGILIDGTGYGKNTTDHYQLISRTHEFVESGWPVLMALSNKEFVSESLGVEREQRLTGTLAATTVAALGGASVFRAHQVEQTRQTLEMVACIQGTRPPAQEIRWIS
jgi:dihydropteroate synthase